MRYLIVIIWSLLISTVISYVVTSMAGEPFSITYTFVMSAFFFIAIVILGEGILKENKEQ